MASYRDRFRDQIARKGATTGTVLIGDLLLALRDVEWLDKDNDELRRENERLLKVLAEQMPSMGDGVKATVLPEMCCGGTCVRAVCPYHGAGND